MNRIRNGGVDRGSRSRASFVRRRCRRVLLIRLIGGFLGWLLNDNTKMAITVHEVASPQWTVATQERQSHEGHQWNRAEEWRLGEGEVHCYCHQSRHDQPSQATRRPTSLFFRPQQCDGCNCKLIDECFHQDALKIVIQSIQFISKIFS